MIFSAENWFLLIIGLIWVIGAVMQDLKRREVDNLWNFSLIGFALAYRASVSIYSGEYLFLLNGIFGFGIFLFLGNLFYYSRLFAGGDAKLVIALGTILPLSYDWVTNFEIFGSFIILFLFLGSIYALIWAGFLVVMNWKAFIEEYKNEWKRFRKMFYIALIFTLIWIIAVFYISEIKFIFIGLVILLFPVLFVFAKSVEESCMVKKVSPDKVTEGDWLYRDIKIGRKTIKASWEGVSKKDLKILRTSRKKVFVKYGIPFTPSFLFSLIGLIFLDYYYGWF